MAFIGNRISFSQGKRLSGGNAFANPPHPQFAAMAELVDALP
jgi:hypothetical protein